MASNVIQKKVEGEQEGQNAVGTHDASLGLKSFEEAKQEQSLFVEGVKRFPENDLNVLMSVTNTFTTDGIR